MNNQKGFIDTGIVFIILGLLLIFLGFIGMIANMETRENKKIEKQYAAYLECEQKTANLECCLQQVYGITINEE